MSRMGEHALDIPDDNDAAWWDYCQRELSRDPAFLAWLDVLNANRTETIDGTHGESERRIDVHPGF